MLLQNTAESFFPDGRKKKSLQNMMEQKNEDLEHAEKNKDKDSE